MRNDADRDAALADFWFEKGSRHLSYIFRHTNLLHEDGSLSLHELLLSSRNCSGRLEPCIEKDFSPLYSLTLPKFRFVSEAVTTQCVS